MTFTNLSEGGAERRLLLEARALWQAQRVDQAEHLLRSILADNRQHAEALVALAELLGASGRPDDAIETLNSLVAAQPSVGAYSRRLGAALLARGDFDGAMRTLERAVELDPANARGHNNLGEAYLARGEPERAIACYRRAIGSEPRYAQAYSNLGRALLRVEKPAEAIETLEAAIALAPALVAAHINLGGALYALRSFAAAVGCFELATQLDSKLAVAWSGKADAEFSMGASRAALESTERALLLDPDHGPALVTRACALRALARPGEARRCLERALAVNPDDVNALSELGALLGSESQYAAASAILDRLAAMAPELPYVQGYRLYANLLCANWTGYGVQSARLRDAADRHRRACTPFQSLLFFESATTQRRCAETFVGDRYPAVPPRVSEVPMRASGVPAAPMRSGRIRIAYLSGDFGEHAVSRVLAGVLERHDASQFETLALGWGRQRDGLMRARIEGAVSRFIDHSDRDDAEIVGLLRDSRVDIAVDLMGHTRGQRTAILAGRAAPVQVNFLGFPGTMGAPYMDYLIADAVVVPDGEEGAYLECIVRLPHCYLPCDCRRLVDGVYPSRAEVGLPDSGFVFCAFNNTFKLTPQWFDIWMRLLSAVPGSVLWLRSDDPAVAANLREAAGLRGVPPDRLVFAGREDSMAAHLARYRLADLFLDTLPYNAHATACDALSAGLPVLTCRGSTFCGRVGSSLLTTLGFRELIAADAVEYERLALRLARDRVGLAAIRAALEQRCRDSPLFDSDLYCRHLEAAYRTMWQRAQDGLPPESFAVSPDLLRLTPRAEPIAEKAPRPARGGR